MVIDRERLRAGSSMTSLFVGACAFGAITAGFPGRAFADCDVNNPTSGQTVTCDASAPNPDLDGVFGDATVDGVNVNVLAGAEIAFIELLGGADAIRIDGVIRGTDGSGVFVGADAASITNAGLIEGADFGVQASNIANLVNQEDGIIRATDTPSSGVFAFGDLTSFDNAGTIEGVNVGLAVAGVLVDGVNTGVIRATDTDGTISAALSAGDIGNFVNAGTIEGGATGLEAFGVGLDDGRIASLTNQAGGVIRGRLNGVIGGDGADVVSSAGFVGATETGGAAFDLRGGDDALTLTAGDSTFGFAGALLGGVGVDVLNLNGVGGAINFDQVSGFESVAFGTDGAPSEWSFTGATDLDVTVGDGVRFSGEGAVGSLSVLSGGVLAPGGSIGAVNVARDVSFAPGSTFEVEVEATQNGLTGDRLVAGGAVSIQGGTLRVIPTALQGVDFVNGDSLPIIQAGGGVSGAFDQIQGIGGAGSLGFSTQIQGDELLLLVDAVDFSVVAQDSNQAGVGGALSEAGAESAEVAAVGNAVSVLPADQQARALQTLSGQPHAESIQAAAQASQQGRNGGGSGGGAFSGGAAGPVRIGGGDSPFSAFVGPVFTFGGQENGEFSGYDVSNRGFGGGGDFDFKNGLTGGVTLDYSRFRAESVEGLGRTTSNNVSVGLRSAFIKEGWTFRAAGSYTFILGMESVRNIEIGDQRLQARADIDAFGLAGNGSVTYTFKPQPTLKKAIISPFTFVDYVRFDRDGFTETGASGDSLVVDGVDFGAFDANLTVDAEVFDSVLLGGGVNTAWRIEGDKLGYGPSLLLGVSYESADNQASTPQQFSSVSQGVGEFIVNAQERNRVFGRVGVGLIISPKFLTGGFGFGYEAQIDADQVQHILGFRAAQRF